MTAEGSRVPAALGEYVDVVTCPDGEAVALGEGAARSSEELHAAARTSRTSRTRRMTPPFATPSVAHSCGLVCRVADDRRGMLER